METKNPKILSKESIIILKKVRLINTSFNGMKNIFGILLLPKETTVVLVKENVWRIILNMINGGSLKEIKYVELSSYKVRENRLRMNESIIKLNKMDTEIFVLNDAIVKEETDNNGIKEEAAIKNNEVKEETKEETVVENNEVSKKRSRKRKNN